MAGRLPALIIVAAITLAGAARADSDLTLTQSVLPAPMVLGEAATITVEVTNLGPDPATSVSVVQSVPGGATIQSASDDGQIDGVNLTVTWAVALLNPGETRTLSAEILAGLNVDSAITRVTLAARDSDTDEATLFLVDPALGSAANLITLPAIGELTDASGQGPIYVADAGEEAVEELGSAIVDGQIFDDTGAIVSAGNLLVNPANVVVLDGTLFVADANGVRFDGSMQLLPDTTGRILRVDPQTGAQEMLTEGGFLTTPQAMTRDGEGRLVVGDANGNLVRISAVNGDQELLTSGGQIVDPVGLALGLDDTLYLADRSSGLVSIAPDTFTQTVLASVGSPPEFAAPGGLSISLSGRLFVSVNAAPGFLLEFDPIAESFVGTTSGLSAGFARPGGSATTDEVLTETTVDFVGTDPVPGNNLLPLTTQVIRFPPAPSIVSISVNEAIMVSDQESVMPATLIQAIESITVTDAESVSPALLISVLESIGVTDADSVAAATLVAVRELVSVTDSSGATPPVNPPTVAGLLPTERFCEGETLVLSDAPVTRLEVGFNQEMLSGSLPGGAENPENYRIAEGSSCERDAGDLINSAVWDAERQEVLLTLNGGDPLPAGDYEFLACDRLEAMDGQRLDGDGDGMAGGTYRQAFRVRGANLLRNPNFDIDGAGWDSQGELSEGDALGLARSRSITVGEQETLAQCVELTPGQPFLRASLAARSQGASRFEVRFDFASDADCQSVVSTQPVTLESPSGGAWNRIFTDTPIPPGARSVRLILTPDGAASFDALSLYVAESAFGSSFEGGECGINFTPVVELPDARLTQ